MTKRHQKFISNKEAADLNLPLKRGNIREDGFIFRRYYISGISGNVCEVWQSKEAKEKERIRRREAQKRRAKDKPPRMEYLSAKERDELGLPLRFGDTREDGFRFRYYYKRNNSINELWLNKASFQEVLQRKRTTSNKKRLSNRDYVRRVKMFLGCSICGYKKHPDALHFDHLNPTEKVREISKFHTSSRGALKKEMKKCRVLCANCHAEHTAKQLKNGII
jgi:hypothetical protein